MQLRRSKPCLYPEHWQYANLPPGTLAISTLQWAPRCHWGRESCHTQAEPHIRLTEKSASFQASTLPLTQHWHSSPSFCHIANGLVNARQEAPQELSIKAFFLPLFPNFIVAQMILEIAYKGTESVIQR